MTPAVLIACVGNIFAGDDAFGVEVARRLAGRPLPPGVRVVDFGIRAIDLAYALQDECDAALLVDAAPRGGAPGTLYVIEPELAAPGADPSLVAHTHAFDATAMLRAAGALQGRCRRVLILGCEPQALGDEIEGAMGLSSPVAEALERATGMAEALALQLAGEMA
jgi:hydrogenase maturation protease